MRTLVSLISAPKNTCAEFWSENTLVFASRPSLAHDLQRLNQAGHRVIVIVRPIARGCCFARKYHAREPKELHTCWPVKSQKFLSNLGRSKASIDQDIETISLEWPDVSSAPDEKSQANSCESCFEPKSMFQFGRQTRGQPSTLRLKANG